MSDPADTPVEHTMEGNTMAVTEQDQQQRTQAITKATAREPVPFAPRSFDDGYRQAQALARSGLIPRGLKGNNLDETTANVMVVLMWGHELGVSPVQSMFNIHVIHGRPAVSAALKVGLVKQSPECLYMQCIETSATQATWETHRKGNAKPTRVTFTLEDAKKAKLYVREGGDDNWAKWTATMLRWRAGAMLADAEYPDVTRGLGTQDERPYDEGTTSAIPETRPVEVVTQALPEPQPTRTLERAPEPVAVPRMTLDEVLNAPPGSLPGGEVVITDAPPREPGSDDGDEDPITAEAYAIVRASEADGLTREQLDSLTKRGAALPEGAEKRAVGVALRVAQKRLKEVAK